jgi:ABC-type glycerol-3-phosphate transport system permease component
MTMPRAWLHIFENSLKYILLIILAIFALFPIVWIMSTSLKTRADYLCKYAYAVHNPIY